MEDTKPPAAVNAGQKRTSAQAQLAEQPSGKRPSLQQSLDYARQDYDRVVAERDQAQSTHADLNKRIREMTGRIQELTREKDKAVQQAVDATSWRLAKETERADELEERVHKFSIKLDERNSMLIAERAKTDDLCKQGMLLDKAIEAAKTEAKTKLEEELTLIKFLEERTKGTEKYVKILKENINKTEWRLTELDINEKVKESLDKTVNEHRKKASLFEQQISVFNTWKITVER